MLSGQLTLDLVEWLYMFVCLDNQISVHISQKNHPNSLGENKGLYNFIFMDYLDPFNNWVPLPRNSSHVWTFCATMGWFLLLNGFRLILIIICICFSTREAFKRLCWKICYWRWSLPGLFSCIICVCARKLVYTICCTVCKHLKCQGFGSLYQCFTAVINAFPFFSIYIQCTRCLTINT